MMLLPLGKERGVTQGTVFTVWKDKREAARIRVQSSRDGFLLAYILPRFGDHKNFALRLNLHHRNKSKTFRKNASNYSNKNFHYIHMPPIIEWLFHCFS